MRHAAAIDVKELWAGYRGSMVLRGLDLRIEPGVTALLVGPNGHGKTTLLRTISGLLRPERGRVLVDGVDVSGKRAEHIAALGLSHVPQGDGLFPEMTIQENLMMGAFQATAWSKRHDYLDRVYGLLPTLRPIGQRRARTLSGGERRLAALGRAFMQDAKILLIDEPSLGLAPIMVETVYEAISSLKRETTTLLLVEENFANIHGLADIVHILENGEIVRSAPFADVEADTAVLETYLGGTSQTGERNVE